MILARTSPYRFFNVSSWSASLSLTGEPAPQRYQYPACTRLPSIPYPGCMIQVRGPELSPTRSVPQRTKSGSLAEIVSSVTHASLQPGSNTSFFFMSVHAMTSIFAASLMRILVVIPFSRSLPLSFLVK